MNYQNYLLTSSETRNTWTGAREDCESQYGFLVRFVNSSMASAVTGTLGVTEDIWIDLNDMVNGK